jgi:hypothetical protein
MRVLSEGGIDIAMPETPENEVHAQTIIQKLEIREQNPTDAQIDLVAARGAADPDLLNREVPENSPAQAAHPPYLH